MAEHAESWVSVHYSMTDVLQLDFYFTIENRRIVLFQLELVITFPISSALL